MRFWIGARGADMGSEGRGITAVTAGEADSSLAGGAFADLGVAVEAPSPTWLAPHPQHEVVYAALEGAGRVAAYRRTGDAALEMLGTPADVGDGVCHIAVAPDGSRLVASCYGDGRVTHVPLRGDGSLGEPAQGRAADDPYAPGGMSPDWASTGVDFGAASAAERAALDVAQVGAGAGAEETPSGFLIPSVEDVAGLLADAPSEPSAAERLAQQRAQDEADALSGISDGEAPATDADGSGPAEAARRPSRAHSATFLPDGRVATTDLGYDLVRVWRVTPSGLVPDHEIVLPFGVGPRHMVMHPSGHLHVITEFSCEVWTLAEGPDARWRVVASVSTGAFDGDTGAELTPGHGKLFLYAGLRGSDTIQVLRVGGEGERLEPVALVDSGITVPRHHVVVRDTLLVAGQDSEEIASLSLDERTGVPGSVRHRLETPRPQHILPVR
ncbi:lactonase family protein [Microbacterium halotolerans]|uniref:lactonase family protein n=1 Tax=Microbacterium halotolerans TaxID=246613 RepID=UPI000E6AA528|nr:beta-propeller fold lactonase family protein [Microbacterium halotolerans]